MAQTPPAQLGVPWFALHAFAQAPQFATSVASVASQPFVALASQLP
jgi:hypothetical protein